MAKKNKFIKNNWDILGTYILTLISFGIVLGTPGYGVYGVLAITILVLFALSIIIVIRTLKIKKLNNWRLLWISPHLFLGIWLIYGMLFSGIAF